ncbi:MAG: hypothetical protein ACYTGX_11680 [Planctomycetota bacterium]
MRKFTVFALSSLGAVTLLAGTAAAGAAGLWMYSTKHAGHSASHARHAEWMERNVGELPECLELEEGCEGECPTVEVEIIPAPVPAPTPPAAAPAPLDRDEEVLTLKAQLADALQRIAELEAERAPAAPESTPAPQPGGDF